MVHVFNYRTQKFEQKHYSLVAQLPKKSVRPNMIDVI